MRNRRWKGKSSLQYAIRHQLWIWGVVRNIPFPPSARSSPPLTSGGRREAGSAWAQTSVYQVDDMIPDGLPYTHTEAGLSTGYNDMSLTTVQQRRHCLFS